MVVLEIESVKVFMTCLFQQEVFDKFHVRDCEVTTFTRFSCDGKNFDEWYEEEEKKGEELVRWKQLKPLVFMMIRGTKTPLQLKIEFCHTMANGDTGAMRVEYDREKLLIYTGYMQKEFSMDKENQREWDENCMLFLKKNNIISTQL